MSKLKFKVVLGVALLAILFGLIAGEGFFGPNIPNTKFYIYLIAVAALLMIITGLMIIDKSLLKKNKKLRTRKIYDEIMRYKFLIKQLVSRDFKTKYKRSILGAFWSFLNPLLSMSVQYVVFSTLFKTDIKNYPVYLLTGIILFNFFTEAISLGLTSIVTNSTLITKVSVPKYIYPMTRVLSSSVNLFISVLPLLIVTLITGVMINIRIVLLVFPIICLIVFSMGLVFIMSASMTFFRDTQFIWSILSMIWTYATPIFYPAEIVPEKFRFIQTFNPLYHIITFARTVVMNGSSPAPTMYLVCLGSALLMFVVGLAIFRKVENKFVLYI